MQAVSCCMNTSTIHSLASRTKTAKESMTDHQASMKLDTIPWRIHWNTNYESMAVTTHESPHSCGSRCQNYTNCPSYSTSRPHSDPCCRPSIFRNSPVKRWPPFYQLLSLLKKTLKANDSQNALLWTAPVILLHCNGVSSVACKETYLPHLLILCKIHLEKSEIEICMQEICNTSTVYILYLNIINQLLPLPMLSRQEGPC